jgi:hypothetical protein
MSLSVPLGVDGAAGPGGHLAGRIATGVSTGNTGRPLYVAVQQEWVSAAASTSEVPCKCNTDITAAAAGVLAQLQPTVAYRYRTVCHDAERRTDMLDAVLIPRLDPDLDDIKIPVQKPSIKLPDFAVRSYTHT